MFFDLGQARILLFLFSVLLVANLRSLSAIKMSWLEFQSELLRLKRTVWRCLSEL